MQAVLVGLTFVVVAALLLLALQSRTRSLHGFTLPLLTAAFAIGLGVAYWLAITDTGLVAGAGAAESDDILRALRRRRERRPT